jgi:hypothetical protein
VDEALDTPTEAVAEIDPVDAVPDPDEPEGADASTPGYVPMSEWLDDFDRR